MAFLANASICQQNNCNDVVITDTSTGYDTGAVTIDGNAVTAATIQILVGADGLGDSITYSVIEEFLAATTQEDLVFNLADEEGYTKYSDGPYTVIYTITTSAETFSKTMIKFLVCSIECCINKKIATIPGIYNCDRCDVSSIDRIMTMYALFQSLKGAAAVGNYTNANTIFNLLTKLCAYSNCNCN